MDSSGDQQWHEQSWRLKEQERKGLGRKEGEECDLGPGELKAASGQPR